MTPIQAIRRKCIDCAGGSYKAVRNCEEEDCPLYPFRLGKNPNRRGMGGGKREVKKKGQ